MSAPQHKSGRMSSNGARGRRTPPAPGRASEERLVREVERYLAAVALYRQLGCQPTWRPEAASP